MDNNLTSSTTTDDFDFPESYMKYKTYFDQTEDPSVWMVNQDFHAYLKSKDGSIIYGVYHFYSPRSPVAAETTSYAVCITKVLIPKGSKVYFQLFKFGTLNWYSFYAEKMLVEEILREKCQCQIYKEKDHNNGIFELDKKNYTEIEKSYGFGLPKRTYIKGEWVKNERIGQSNDNTDHYFASFPFEFSFQLQDLADS